MKTKDGASCMAGAILLRLAAHSMWLPDVRTTSMDGPRIGPGRAFLILDVALWNTSKLNIPGCYLLPTTYWSRVSAH
ncbi:hypothetical protein GGR51DRAFT_114285 [Nemania sp. FL0031]|nr:hypothetical protein GGR51DRAFT_114285 [Nemania sp. FL0031]